MILSMPLSIAIVSPLDIAFILWAATVVGSSFPANAKEQVEPLVAGVTMAAAAMGSRFMLQAWNAFKARPVLPRLVRFYPGGFQEIMTRREAALILGVRERDVMEKIKSAHRRVSLANHPDRDGSEYLIKKINEARQILERRSGNSGSVF
ncbi:hypothetical protein GIB67_037034 [Kingdonia uniflora]|uniref:J domain-containing protein n=1 Tax=Kingdonia uniflora TaxID=39325 RepID=A0A7J7LHJ3_9MAGN|nr:hypothetical protein GIB67_037034 [Kingdonia uniflora]